MAVAVLHLQEQLVSTSSLGTTLQRCTISMCDCTNIDVMSIQMYALPLSLQQFKCLLNEAEGCAHQHVCCCQCLLPLPLKAVLLPVAAAAYALTYLTKKFKAAMHSGASRPLRSVSAQRPDLSICCCCQMSPCTGQRHAVDPRALC